MNDWSKAAKAYEKSTSQKERSPRATSVAALQKFLDEKGAEAIQLLRASKEKICFAVDSSDGSSNTLSYIFSDKGLQKVTESGNLMAAAMTGNADTYREHVELVSIEEAIRAYEEHGSGSGSLVTYLKRGLDKIAKAAPES